MKSDQYDCQNDVMHKIKRIDIEMYKKILAQESIWYKALEEKIDDMKLVKDKVLEYNQKEAHRLFDSFFKSDLTK